MLVPEICFWALAGGTAMAHGKKHAAGEAERLALLEQAFPGSCVIYKDAITRYLRKDLARDDILDALATAITASRLKAGCATLPDTPPRDRFGLSMEIVYAPSPGVVARLRSIRFQS